MEIKITAVKFETVNGKKTGRSFSFPLDPKKMAEKCKTEATLKKRVEEYVAKSGVFQKEELKDVKYSMKEFLEEWHKQLAVVKAEKKKRLASTENTPESPSPSKYFDLERFITAQNIAYPIALEEMRRGKKTTHWMWYIFPQQKGLGHSHNSNYYGLEGIEEAKAYMEHPILAARFREICQTLLTHAGKRTIDQIMGSNIDVLKLQTSMNLFNKVAPNDVFLEVLEKFY